MSMIAKKGRQQGQEGYDAMRAICPVRSMDPTWHSTLVKITRNSTLDGCDVDDDRIAHNSLANISKDAQDALTCCFTSLSLHSLFHSLAS
ncbi:hypothetical protein DFH29DRAFT_1005581 [Suillus ampliporus]|nr:hypothetical protein DFH29DRAFT_1005581 [Suillus ampliporus]